MCLKIVDYCSICEVSQLWDQVLTYSNGKVVLNKCWHYTLSFNRDKLSVEKLFGTFDKTQRQLLQLLGDFKYMNEICTSFNPY